MYIRCRNSVIPTLPAPKFGGILALSVPQYGQGVVRLAWLCADPWFKNIQAMQRGAQWIPLAEVVTPAPGCNCMESCCAVGFGAPCNLWG